MQGSDHLNGTGNSADNFISGNSGDNVLTGNAGNDVLIGGTGADTMQGGAGDDSYTVDNVNDVVIDLAGEGTDTVNTTVSWTLGANTENVNVNSNDSIQINGNSSANTLTFTRRPAGDDYYGSVGVRAAGGAGDDRYVYAQSYASLQTDALPITLALTELAGGGNDTLQLNLPYVRLPNEIENLTVTSVPISSVEYLIVYGPGERERPKYFGNAANNRIDLSQASSGSSILHQVGGFNIDGGAGADHMIGSTSNDTYFVDNAGDVVEERLATGWDTLDRVVSSVAFTLGANLEELKLIGTGGISGTGNAADNLLISSTNAATNVMTGTSR